MEGAGWLCERHSMLLFGEHHAGGGRSWSRQLRKTDGRKLSGGQRHYSTLEGGWSLRVLMRSLRWLNERRWTAGALVLYSMWVLPSVWAWDLSQCAVAETRWGKPIVKLVSVAYMKYNNDNNKKNKNDFVLLVLQSITTEHFTRNTKTNKWMWHESRSVKSVERNEKIMRFVV